MTDNTPLWTPSEAFQRSTPIYAFMQHCNATFAQNMASYSDLHRWSVDQSADFWTAVWDFCEIKGHRGKRALINGEQMLDAAFFPDATLNFAENLLSTNGSADAIIFRAEDRASDRWSWDNLHEQVSKLQQAFVVLGIAPGDRIAAMMPNLPETVACMLAATSIGAFGHRAPRTLANRA